MIQRKTIYPIYIFLILSACQQLMAQVPPKNALFRRLSINDGLSQISLYTALQDKEGFMWFGTQEGLNMYDGHKFTIYKNDPLDNESITNSVVYCLYEDNLANIWVGTEQGLCILNKRTGKFRIPFKNKGANLIGHERISSIVGDEVGNIWVGTDGDGLYKFDSKSFACKQYKANSNRTGSLTSNGISALYIDKKQNLWIGTIGGGLNLYQTKSDKFISFNHFTSSDLFGKQSKINCIYQSISGIYWIGTDRGLIRFDEDNQLFEPIKYQSNYLYSVEDMFEDSFGNLWLATFGNGLNIYHIKTHQITAFTYDINNPHSISNNNITKMVVDKEKTVWFATYTGGISLYNKSFNKFKTYKYKVNDRNSISGNNIVGLFADKKDHLWVGTWGDGLNNLNTSGDTNIIFKHIEGNRNSIASNIINKVAEDQDEQIWIPTGNYGLSVYNKKTKQFKHYRHNSADSGSISSNQVLFVYVDKSNEVWCGTYAGGLSRFDRKSEQFINYRNIPNNTNSISTNTVLCIYEDRQGLLWIGTWGGGLSVFDKMTGLFRNYKNIKGNPTSINDNIISFINESSSGEILLCTSRGLNIYNRKNNTFRAYTEKDGLPNNVVYAIYEDKKKRFWISTNNGIACLSFDHGRLKSKNYTEKDGLACNEFNGMASCITSTGNIYFGGPNGITYFHPDSIETDHFVAPIVITDFQLFNKSIGINDETHLLQKSILYTDTILLEYNQDVFSLQFTSLSFVNSEKNLYAYMLEGFNKNWNYTDASRRFATYTNLDPGTYKFMVKSCNSDGVWNQSTTDIYIIISPPFYRTWWFILIVLLLVLGIIIWAVRMATVRKYKKKLIELEHLQEIEAIRSRIARDIHDDIGAELTQITLLAEITKSQGGIDKDRNYKLEKLATSARNVIHNLGEIIWAVNPQYDNLNGLIAYFSNYISNLLEDNDLVYEIDFPQQIHNIPVNPDVRRNLFLVLKEALINVIKHSKATEVVIRFETQGNDYTMTIQDNGIGIREDKISAFGNGMKNMKSRMGAIHGSIKIDTNENKGTTILVQGAIF